LAAKSSDRDGLGVLTIEMKTSFLRPARGEIHALGWCDHYSTTMAFCRAELRDTHGRVLAQGMGTFKRMRTLGRRRHKNSD
jgi:acyl-coenzyme A thioesterase PaaI-like protein